MAAEDPTTWGEVCKNVGFSDNLYRTCRKNVPEFNGFAGGGAPPQEPPGPDFGVQLAGSALPVPPPPPADWQPEAGDSGFMEGMFGDLTPEKIAMYGGVAALIWWFFMRNKNEAPAATTEQKPVTSPKAA